MTAAARDRAGAELKKIVAAAVFIIVEAPGVFYCNGQPVAKKDVCPDVVWLSHDVWRYKLLGPLLEVAISQNPKWVQGHMAGLDHPAWRKILLNGTRVTKSIGASVPVAEYVMAHALSLMVPLDQQRQAQNAVRWVVTPYKEVRGSRWTIVGLGGIGREVAARAAAFGAQIIGVRRTPGIDQNFGTTHELEALPDLLREADVVLLSIPATRKTHKLADAAFFAALKPGAILINVARGSLIDYDALRAGLKVNRPAHAVLDTFEKEPLDRDSWLWTHPQVRVTAHTSWFGNKNGERMDAQFLENFARFAAGDPLVSEADISEAELA